MQRSVEASFEAVSLTMSIPTETGVCGSQNRSTDTFRRLTAHERRLERIEEGKAAMSGSDPFISAVCCCLLMAVRSRFSSSVHELRCTQRYSSWWTVWVHFARSLGHLFKLIVEEPFGDPLQLLLSTAAVQCHNRERNRKSEGKREQA